MKQNRNLSAVLLTGTSVRHNYFINTMNKYFDIKKSYKFAKHQKYLPEENDSQKLHKYYNRLHEERIFKQDSSDELVNIGQVGEYSISELLSTEIIKLRPEIILVFGAPILPENLIANFKERIYNIHLGYSPYYRGSGTLFWAWKNRDIYAFATTLHLIDKGIDTGDILRWITAPTIKDGYYSASNKLIKNTIDVFAETVILHSQGGLSPVKQNLSHSYNYKRSDFLLLPSVELSEFVRSNI